MIIVRQWVFLTLLFLALAGCAALPQKDNPYVVLGQVTVLGSIATKNVTEAVANDRIDPTTGRRLQSKLVAARSAIGKSVEALIASDDNTALGYLEAARSVLDEVERTLREAENAS